MVSMQKPYKKAKLPRKRKKQAIKAQGRKWYYDTIRLYEITCKSGRFYEPICKFWVNSSIRVVPCQLQNGSPIMIKEPTKYW